MEQQKNLPAVKSQNSQIQSQKPNSLLNFIQNAEEYAIVTAIQKSTRVEVLQDTEGLAKVVAKWRAYLGIPKDGADPEELAVVIMYIREHWGMLTLAEIELALTLSINRKLDDDEFYGLFSPNYVAKVLHAYMYYRKITLADALRKREKFELEQASLSEKPSPEEECETTKELFIGFYKELERNGFLNDPFNLAYNFLRKYKWLKVSETDIQESMAAGKIRFQEEQNKQSLLRQVSENQEVEIKRYARNHLVAQYLKNVDINVLLNNIKPELFT